MTVDLVAQVSTAIRAPLARVWQALVDPDLIKQYMFGTTVASTWKKGAPITWTGEWKGKPYQDKGTILEITPEQRLQYTHFSPLAGVPDAPENYHTVTIDLVPEGDDVRVTLTQDNNPSPEAREHSEKNWTGMLDGLKKLLER
jgi:uncharacterized protein YndB with AHSA1/START domain